jgi:lipopolysaccharide export system protein LptC
MSLVSSPDTDQGAHATGLRSRFRAREQQKLSQRYSRFVGMMKLLLPMIGLGLIVVVLAWPNENGQDAGFHLSFASGEAPDADQLVMVNPRYLGTDRSRRPFTVTAATATQDPENQRRVTLNAPQADMTMEDGSWLTVLASRGIYHQGEQTLSLEGPVNIFSDLGYEFHAESASIDLTTGSARSEHPVYGQGPFGSVRADRLEAQQNGQRLLFEGNVHMIIRPGTGS